MINFVAHFEIKSLKPHTSSNGRSHSFNFARLCSMLTLTLYEWVLHCSQFSCIANAKTIRFSVKCLGFPFFISFVEQRFRLFITNNLHSFSLMKCNIFIPWAMGHQPSVKKSFPSYSGICIMQYAIYQIWMSNTLFGSACDMIDVLPPFSLVSKCLCKTMTNDEYLKNIPIRWAHQPYKR